MSAIGPERKVHDPTTHEIIPYFVSFMRLRKWTLPSNWTQKEMDATPKIPMRSFVKRRAWDSNPESLAG